MKLHFRTKTILALTCCFFSKLVLAGDVVVNFMDDKGSPLIDAVVEIYTPSQPVPEDWSYTGVMDQIDKEFVENVVLVVANSYVEFPNSDEIHHHVYSFSDNKSFELPLYIGDSANPILFDEPGVTVVGCNIHDWMLGYIYVGQTHQMAKSDESGRARIAGLPAGDYEIKIWHERAKNRDINKLYQIEVPEQGSGELNLELKLNRSRRLRRAPEAGAKQY